MTEMGLPCGSTGRGGHTGHTVPAPGRDSGWQHRGQVALPALLWGWQDPAWDTCHTPSGETLGQGTTRSTIPWSFPCPWCWHHVAPELGLWHWDRPRVPKVRNVTCALPRPRSAQVTGAGNQWENRDEIHPKAAIPGFFLVIHPGFFVGSDWGL